MEKIVSILKNVERMHNVKILYACETGSRAWGFPSPDSDFDIRFVYMHEKDWYLSLFERKDSIEYLEGDWDVSGWDIRKSLLLLKKSNAPLIERFNSPIVYFYEETFVKEFNRLIEEYYNPVAVFYHHYTLANKIWEELKLQKQYKLKSFFYLVRSLLSCIWITESDEIVPMQITLLMNRTDRFVKNRIEELIQLKATVGEKHQQVRSDELFNWISEVWDRLEHEKKMLIPSGAGINSLDDFFLNLLKDVDYK